MKKNSLEGIRAICADGFSSCRVVIKDGWVFHADLRGFKRRFSEIFRWRGRAGYMEISMCLTHEKNSLEGIGNDLRNP